MQRGDSWHKGQGDLEYKRMAGKDKIQSGMVKTSGNVTRLGNQQIPDFGFQPTELVWKIYVICHIDPQLTTPKFLVDLDETRCSMPKLNDV